MDRIRGLLMNTAIFTLETVHGVKQSYSLGVFTRPNESRDQDPKRTITSKGDATGKQTTDRIAKS